MIKDERWPVARLIPITTFTGVEARERNAASALLAVLSVVEEFGRSLLKPLGAPAGKIETFTEVPLKLEGKTMRPDGLIAVTRAKKTWWALVECKVADQQLEVAQMEAYLDLARANEIDAVLSISNQYTTMSSEYPIVLDRKKARRMSIHHWSWVQVLTEAEVQRKHRGVKDPDQAYILGELIRFLSDRHSGVVQFNDMGPEWTSVRDDARVHTLRKADPKVTAVAARWDALIQYVVLGMTKELGRDVRQVLGRDDATAATRLQVLRDSLVASGRLHARLHIPNTAGHLEVVADLVARQVTVAVELDAPKEGRSRGRVGWLLRQLSKAPAETAIEARVTRLSATRDIRSFRVSLTRDLGLNRLAGRGSFIDSINGAVLDFYREVLQNLAAWHARAPRLGATDDQIEDGIADVSEPLEEGLHKAAAEADDGGGA